MNNVAVYALLVLGGKSDPSVADVEKALKDSGLQANQAEIKKVVDGLKGKNLSEVITAGLKQVGSLSFGGGSAPAAAAAPADKKGAEKPAEKKAAAPPPPPPKEEEEDFGAGGMFDF